MMFWKFPSVEKLPKSSANDLAVARRLLRSSAFLGGCGGQPGFTATFVLKDPAEKFVPKPPRLPLAVGLLISSGGRVVVVGRKKSSAPRRRRSSRMTMAMMILVRRDMAASLFLLSIGERRLVFLLGRLDLEELLRVGRDDLVLGVRGDHLDRGMLVAGEEDAFADAA